MKFAQPIWLLVGVIACAALVWRYRRFDARQRAELAKFASQSLIAQLTTSVSATRRHGKRALVIVGVACLALALARPLFGFRWEEARRKGLDLLFAVDTSKSMLAQDVKPDRLTRAKMAVEDLLAKMEGDRVGLIAFAGNSFLQCPLTLDFDAFRQSLDALDSKIIPRGGTDIATAIHEAEAALEGNGNNERILVLLTDGEDLEGNALDAAREAAKNGLKIFTVGVGSANGELIPSIDEQNGTQFTKDASGQFVKSRLDESMLKQIAEATGAMYQPLGRQGQGLETIYQQGLAKFTRREVASRMQKVYLERFQWPLALGLLCLVIEPLIGIRRSKRVTKTAAVARPAMLVSWNKMARPATAAAAIAFLIMTNPARASVGTAEQAFQKGDYTRAEQEYQKAAGKSPDKPVLQFNHGAAAYKSGNFDTAAVSFARAMKAEDLNLQQDNYYNLGNTQYRLGQKTEKANAQETIKTWEQAVQSYEAALQLKADDADAKYNRDLVKKKLEELKKQQQQQKENQDKDQQQQDQKNQDQKDQKDQSKQDEQKNQQDKQSGGSDQDNKPDQKDNKDQNSKNDQQENSGSGQDQNKPEEKKGQQDKKDGGSNQSDKQDSKNDQGQYKADQQQKPGPDQNKKDEKKDSQDKQNGNSGQESKQDQKPEQKDTKGQSGEKPDQAKKDGQPQPRHAQPKEAGQEQADARPEPGKMSRNEARQLLDSLKDGDRKMPLSPYSRGTNGGRNDEPLKDW